MIGPLVPQVAARVRDQKPESALMENMVEIIAKNITKQTMRIVQTFQNVQKIVS
jgi:hypothetical protein